MGASISPSIAASQGVHALFQTAQTKNAEQTTGQELTPEEEKEVQELKQRDSEVRAHEQAHKTVGGPYAGAISYETTTGPDGREYAVGGEVQIDVSPVPNNPEATIQKMDVVERAALAPAEPSPQDFAVARTAQQIRIQAQTELLEQQAEEQKGEKQNPIEQLIEQYTKAEDSTALDTQSLFSITA